MLFIFCHMSYIKLSYIKYVLNLKCHKLSKYEGMFKISTITVHNANPCDPSDLILLWNTFIKSSNSTEDSYNNLEKASFFHQQSVQLQAVFIFWTGDYQDFKILWCFIDISITTTFNALHIFTTFKMYCRTEKLKSFDQGKEKL